MKLSHIFESLPINKAKYMWIPGGEDREVAWAGGKIAHGSEKDVSIELPQDTDEWVSHTHPSENPSEFTALPSEQDLNTAAEMARNGIPGMIIFSGDYFTIIKPTKEQINTSGYKAKIGDAIKKNDLDAAIKLIENIGFEVGIGER